MNAQSPTSPAELADRTVQMVAYAMFAIALVFCLSVVEYFATEPMASTIDIVVKALGLTVLVLMAVLLFWKIRPMSPSQRRRHLVEDGYLQIAFRRAMANSWMVSFLVLVLLLFSVFFLLYTRSGSSDE